MKIRTGLIAPILVAALLPGGAAIAQADETKTPRLGKGISLLTNPEMSELRGRYTVSDNQVLYFGVEMASTWKTQDGQQLQGGANFSLDFSDKGGPQVSFSPTVSISSTQSRGETADTSRRTVSTSGVDNVSGLGQSIQVAGDFNSASNTLGIKILDKTPQRKSGAGIGQSLRVTNTRGGEVSSILNKQGATVTLSLDGQGVVQQSIRGVMSGGTGQGAFQSIKTLGDFHTITNRMQLSIVMKPETDVSNLRKTLGISLGGLRGL